jgi:peptidoglycan/LPS O-acetylase OafA/YrhL
MSTSSNQPDFRPDLQGLRAIAILLVVLAHANVPYARGGFIGVDVCFVLSGYLISGLLIRELRQTGRIRFLRFYARRLKRLLPALAMMLLVGTAATLWLLSDLEARAQLASAPFAAAWASNLYFAFLGVDYFNELAARDLFLHTWSLGVEEQFYLIWPRSCLRCSCSPAAKRVPPPETPSCGGASDCSSSPASPLCSSAHPRHPASRST